MGLSGTPRLVNEFEIDSEVGKGTHVAGSALAVTSPDRSEDAERYGGDGRGRTRARSARSAGARCGRPRSAGLRREQARATSASSPPRRPPTWSATRAGRGADQRAGARGERAAWSWSALDRGPAWRTSRRCMRDGFSTRRHRRAPASAPCAGWPTLLDIYSAPGVGTALVCRFWPGARRAARATVRAWARTRRARCGRDGLRRRLGRDAGPGARRSSSPTGWATAPAAAAAARGRPDLPGAEPRCQPEHVLGVLHARPPRAPAAPPSAVALIDGGRRESATPASATSLARSSTGGQRPQSGLAQRHRRAPVRKIQEFVYPWPPGALLVMHSDGLATHWKLEPYPGLPPAIRP